MKLELELECARAGAVQDGMTPKREIALSARTVNIRYYDSLIRESPERTLLIHFLFQIETQISHLTRPGKPPPPPTLVAHAARHSFFALYMRPTTASTVSPNGPRDEQGPWVSAFKMLHRKIWPLFCFVLFDFLISSAIFFV